MGKTVRAINYQIENIGKIISSSKKRYVWDLQIDGRNYKVVFTHSKLSGKQKVQINGEEVFSSKSFVSKPLNCNFEKDGNAFVVASYGDVYKLFVNSKDFDEDFGYDKVKSILKKSKYEEEIEAHRSSLLPGQPANGIPPLRGSLKTPSSSLSSPTRSKSSKKVSFNINEKLVSPGDELSNSKGNDAQQALEYINNYNNPNPNPLAAQYGGNPKPVPVNAPNFNPSHNQGPHNLNHSGLSGSQLSFDSYPNQFAVRPGVQQAPLVNPHPGSGAQKRTQIFGNTPPQMTKQVNTSMIGYTNSGSPSPIPTSPEAKLPGPNPSLAKYAITPQHVGSQLSAGSHTPNQLPIHPTLPQNSPHGSAIHAAQMRQNLQAQQGVQQGHQIANVGGSGMPSRGHRTSETNLGMGDHSHGGGTPSPNHAHTSYRDSQTGQPSQHQHPGQRFGSELHNQLAQGSSPHNNSSLNNSQVGIQGGAPYQNYPSGGHAPPNNPLSSNYRQSGANTGFTSAFNSQAQTNAQQIRQSHGQYGQPGTQGQIGQPGHHMNSAFNSRGYNN